MDPAFFVAIRFDLITCRGGFRLEKDRKFENTSYILPAGVLQRSYGTEILGSD
jgi:hypothetical protein